MTGYEFHPEARKDLDEIWEYIHWDSTDAADRLIGEVLSAIRGVVTFPYGGHCRSDITNRPLRFIAYAIT